MSVICKMKCHAAPQGDEINDQPQAVTLGAVWEPDEGQRHMPENAVYGKYTPWGEFKVGIANPAAKEFFKPGKSYYLTITEAPD